MDTWKAATPTDPFTLTHVPTEPNMRAIPQTIRSNSPMFMVAGAARDWVPWITPVA